MTGMPRLGIALPVHNGENFLAPALDSILGQDFSDFRLFVSENASTDATHDILADRARRDARIVISSTNSLLPQVANMNRAVRLADTQWVKLICHDDLMHPGCLRRIDAELDRAAAQDVGVICNGETHLFPDGRETTPPADQEVTFRSGHDVVLRFLRGDRRYTIPAVTTATARRDAFDRVGGFDERYRFRVDGFCWIEMLMHSNYLAIPSALTTNRVHAGQSTMALSRELASVTDLRLFLPDFLDRHSAVLNISSGTRLRSQIKPMTEAASKIAVQFLAGEGRTALAMIKLLPRGWWPVLPPMIWRAMMLERRRIRE